MKDGLNKKVLIYGIIILFIGASIIPNIVRGSSSSHIVGPAGAGDTQATAWNHQRKIARDSDGNLYCVYYDFDNDIQFANSSDDGESWSVTELSGDLGVEVTTYNQRCPSIAVISSNNIHVVWAGRHAASTSNFQIRYTKYNGVSWSAVTNLTTDNTYGQMDPSIAVDSSNNVHVVFHGEHAGSANTQIRYTKYNGVSWTAITNVTAYAYNSADSGIAIDSSNNLHVAFYGATADSPSNFQVRYTKYNGVSWSAVINLTTDANRAQNIPSLAIDSSDNLHVVWNGAHSGSGINQIRYTKYNGVSWSPIINLTTDTLREQWLPSISIDGSDNLHVLWHGYHAGSTGIWQIRCINCTNGSWGAIGNLTNDFVDDQQYASTLWAKYPSGVNVLAAGFCFIWTDTHNDNVVFYTTENLPPYTPSNPTPVNGSLYVYINADLSWNCSDPDGDDIVYDVYFEANDPTPDVKVSNNQSVTIYNPETMDYNVTYYWQIVAWDTEGHSTVGPIWHFTTEGLNNPPYTPGNPNPADNATNVDVDADLSWTGGDPNLNDTVTYNVYFEVDDSTPDVLVSNNQTGTTYDPGTMYGNTQYYWRIISWDNNGASAVGPIWSFTTENLPPYTPSNPTPANHATNVDVNADLYWDGGDPDPDDTVTYDVYFGTWSNPPKVASNISDTNYDPGTMNYFTKYYWKIVSWDNHGASKSGPIWDFTTSSEPNDPPYPPSNPDPLDGAMDVDIDADLSWNCSDPDGDDIVYDVYFEANDSTPDVLVSNDQTETTFDPGTLEYGTIYYWKIIAIDEHSAVTSGPIWHFTIEENTSPDAPVIDGPNHGKPNIPYDFIFNSVDPDGDDVKYIINWGDIAFTTTDFNSSGNNVTVSHTWATKGTYTISAKAQDEFGAESGWATFEVTIPRSRAIDNPILRFFENHPMLYKIFQLFLKQFQTQ